MPPPQPNHPTPHTTPRCIIEPPRCSPKPYFSHKTQILAPPTTQFGSFLKVHCLRIGGLVPNCAPSDPITTPQQKHVLQLKTHDPPNNTWSSIVLFQSHNKNVWASLWAGRRLRVFLYFARGLLCFDNHVSFFK